MVSTLQPTRSFTRPAGDVSSFSTSFPPPLTAQYTNGSQGSQEGPGHKSSSFHASFNDSNNVTRRPAASSNNHIIYTASYSSVAVYEMEIGEVAVMRRRADSWLNATQILKVAGIDKGRRTKIIDKEILTGAHDKVQGGYGRYQGTWVPYERGRQLSQQYGVEELLKPLLEYDLKHDGSANTDHADTPTKEQALAANRKRLFSSTLDGQAHSRNNTFFQNISPVAQNALAAMHKAARLDSPMPRPGSAQKPPASLLRRQSSQQQSLSQESMYLPSSQQSNQTLQSEQVNGFDNAHDSFHGQQQGLRADARPAPSREPPRKRARMSFGQDPYLDPSLEDETPTEPNDSFSQQHSQHFARDSGQGLAAIPMLSSPQGSVGEQRRRVLLSMLADNSRSDVASLASISSMSGQDLDIPLDPRGNTALHWAALLGKIFVVRALISKGANIACGNAGGETPLMHAVSVNNTYEANCFSDMLELLGPLIEIRDSIGRTVLHHIAVASGIKGRAQSSRYYLESLLEYTVRQGSASGNVSFIGKAPKLTASSRLKPPTLAKFMSEVVNVQDKCGNTALNLVSRIGSHAIINQLEEIGADFGISNYKGFRPESFGIFPKNQGVRSAIKNDSSSQVVNEDSAQNTDIIKIWDEIVATTQTILSQTQAHYTIESKRLSALLETQSITLRDLATDYAALTTNIANLTAQARNIRERKLRLTNLRSVRDILSQRREHEKHAFPTNMTPSDAEVKFAETDDPMELPHTAQLTTLLRANLACNASLTTRLETLRSAQTTAHERETMYRKVVSLCTEVPEKDVDELLPELLRAVEGVGDPDDISVDDEKEAR